MMKKVILCTVGSLFVYGGLVTGLWGADMAGSGAGVAVTCSDLPGVEACILIKPNGIVEVEAGQGRQKHKPGKPDEAPDPIPEPKDQPKKDLPTDIKDEDYPDHFKKYEITIYAGRTCGNFGGTWVCW